MDAREKVVDEILMSIGEALFGDDFRNRFDMYCNRKKELRLNDVSASICKALSDHDVPPFKGQAIHTQVLKELFPNKEFEGNEEEKEKAETEAMTLESTVDDMLSSDYRDRFRAEYNQLSIRIKRLEKILKGERSVVINCSYTILGEQLRAMKTYLNCLKQRAQFENIKEEE